jgi:hypothetical protein
VKSPYEIQPIMSQKVTGNQLKNWKYSTTICARNCLKLPLRARRVDAQLGSGGSSYDLVGKCKGTERERLSTGQF